MAKVAGSGREPLLRRECVPRRRSQSDDERQHRIAVDYSHTTTDQLEHVRAEPLETPRTETSRVLPMIRQRATGTRAGLAFIFSNLDP